MRGGLSIDFNAVAERGATYPVLYAYDTAGRRTSLSTTRDGTTWDATAWTYDAATGLCTSKTYADGSTVAYTYTPDGLPLRTTYAGGRWTENVYNAKREVVGALYSDGEAVASARDEFGGEVLSSNGVALVRIVRDDSGRATNETAVVGCEAKTIDRTFDASGRLTQLDGTHYAYDSDGLLATVSNETAVVEYSYTPDKLDAGYTITLPNGVTLARTLSRDDYRRSLVTGIATTASGLPVGSLTYTYDALSRPATRNADTFGYNERSEVISAFVTGNSSEYGYDEIGNSTNWTANCLNQYETFPHDADGNLLSDGVYSFTYDSANRLKTVSSNGVVLTTNFYDAKSRRVKKVTQNATTIFFYDGWNLIEERIAYTNGASSTIHYYWGKDLAGTLQGAGGVGGLLYLTIDGVPYVPTYDNNGNITRYLDANGNTVALYTYDAFGKIIAASGTLAHIFRHRFSTKYYNAETGLYYYGYRFYHPSLMRWLNRDPIEEEGGVNLYAYCENNMSNFDSLGCSVFNYLPFSSTVLAAIENYLGHIPGSAVTDYTFVSPRDCKCNIESAEAKCLEKVSREAIEYAANFLKSAATARAVDFGVGILSMRASPKVAAALFVDGGIGLYINQRAAAKIMEGASKARSRNCSCEQYGY